VWQNVKNYQSRIYVDIRISRNPASESSFTRRELNCNVAIYIYMIHRKPIMSTELERQCLNAVSMYQNRQTWKQWGLDKIRRQGAAILLRGPAGCGKTVIAEYLALKIRRRGLKEVSFADFGSQIPGENARQIRKLFASAQENGAMTIYMDECDAILIDRNRLGADGQWMIEIVDELLVQIGKYTGLVILSTNRAETLDPALDRRLLAKIDVPIPEFPERVKLWNQKWPETYPIQLLERQVEQIAMLQLTGAEIENIIINVSSDVIRRKVKPNFLMFLRDAEKEAAKREETKA
jgi:SpoVK/Ycf46/Vps4 family AAA+-type ATPase